MYDTYIYRTRWSRINHYIVKIKSRGLVVSTARWIGRLLGVFQSNPASANKPQPGLFVTPGKAEFAETLTRFRHRGMKIGMIYSGGFEQYNYRNQFADAFKEYGIAEFVTSEFLPEMNHTATLMAQQAAFMHVIGRWCVELNEFTRTASGDALSVRK